MPLQAHHERRNSPTGIPMRRYADFEPGDTFEFEGRLYMKSIDGNAYCTDPLPVANGVITRPDDEWLCEY